MRTVCFRACQVLCACVFAALPAWGARAATNAASTPPAAAKLALVIAIDAYEALPALPQCTVAARNVAAALRYAEFDVTEAFDATNGAINAALATWGQKAPPQAILVAYYCGYAVSFNGRAFLVPLSAELASLDRITVEGVLANSLVKVMDRTDPRAALAFLDIAPAPRRSEMMNTTVLTLANPSPQTTLIAISQADPGGPGNVLAERLRKRTVDLRALVESARDDWRGQPGMVFALSGLPGEGIFLRGAPPPEVATPPPPVDVESQMSDAERRRVQKRLKALGLYGGPIDGIFGVLTRDAIRRYQASYNIEVTGRLGVTEAARLLFVESSNPPR